MAETNKRKTWRGNSSSSEESFSPSVKKAKVITQMTGAFLPLRENTQLRTRIFVNIIFLNLTVYSTVEIENSYRGSDKVKLGNFDTDSFFITLAEECAWAYCIISSSPRIHL